MPFVDKNNVEQFPFTGDIKPVKVMQGNTVLFEPIVSEKSGVGSVTLDKCYNDTADVIVKGNTESSCEWYGKEGLYSQVSTVQGKNLTDGTCYYSRLNSSRAFLLDFNPIISPITTTDTYSGIGFVYPVKSGITYSPSSDCSKESANCYYTFYNDINDAANYNNNMGYGSGTKFTAPKDCYVVCMWYNVASGTVVNWTYTQLEEGSIATAYTPFIPNSPSPEYPSPITPNLPSGTYKVQDYLGDWYEFTLTEDLGGIGDMRDMVAWDKYGRVGWRRNKIGKKVLDGTETYILITTINTTYNLFYTSIVNKTMILGSTICTHFKNDGTLYNGGGLYSLSDRTANTAISFAVPKNITTASEMQSYISSIAPVKTYYQLATPTQTALTFTKNNSSTAPELPMEFITDVPSEEYPATEKKVGVYNDVTGMYDFEVWSHGKNLFDISVITSVDVAGTGAMRFGVIYKNLVGVCTISAQANKNTTYVKKVTSGTIYGGPQELTAPRTFTLSRGDWLIVYSGSNSIIASASVQIEFGLVATSYESHHSDIVNFSLPYPLGTGDEYSVNIKTFYPSTTIIACEDSEIKPTIEVTARQFGI